MTENFKMPLTRVAALIILALLGLVLPSSGVDSDDPWQSLRSLTHRSEFTFVDRDLNCHYGRIKAVTDHSVVIRTDHSSITIDRSNLIRVRTGPPTGPNNPYIALLTVYSARSSWSDLIQFAPVLHMFKSPTEVQMAVTTSDGKLLKGNLKKVTDSEVTLADSGVEISIPKAEISRVDFVREKPLSDAGEYSWSELAMLKVFDPELYPRLFHLGDTMPVRLYERSIPEDNSPVGCI